MLELQLIIIREKEINTLTFTQLKSTNKQVCVNGGQQGHILHQCDTEMGLLPTSDCT